MNKLKEYLKLVYKHLKQGLLEALGAPVLAFYDIHGVSNLKGLMVSLTGRIKPEKGKATWEDLIPGSEWRSIWGDNFIVKTRKEVETSYHEPNPDYIYIYMLTDPITTKKSQWKYVHHVPRKINPRLMSGLMCVNTEKDYKELSKKGDQHGKS